MLPRWFGGALSLGIHLLLLGVATLIALDSVWLFPEESTFCEAPQTAILARPDGRERDLVDRNGLWESQQAPSDVDADWTTALLRGVQAPGVYDSCARQGPIRRATSEALTASLGWLARHQNEDGSWSVDRFDRHCSGLHCDGRGGGRCDDCVTALAVLALFEAGHEIKLGGIGVNPAASRRRNLCQVAVSKGMSWLASRRSYYGGCLGARHLADRLVYESWCGPLFLRVGSIPEELASSQKAGAAGCRDGSWDPESGETNRIYLAALNALRLEGHPDPTVLLGKCEGGYR
jgi:hypothetical protein